MSAGAERFTARCRSGRRFGADKLRMMEDVPSIAALTAPGARVVNTRDPQLLLGGMASCTGWRALNALARAFGDDKLVPLAVGKRLTF